MVLVPVTLMNNPLMIWLGKYFPKPFQCIYCIPHYTTPIITLLMGYSILYIILFTFAIPALTPKVEAYLKNFDTVL